METSTYGRVVVGERHEVPGPSVRTQRDPAPRVGAVSLALLGALLGASPLWGSFYSLGRWGLLAIVAEVVAAALLAARGSLADRWSACALGGLGGLALLSLVSSRWADSSETAIVAGCRWGLYLALFAAVLAMRPGRRELAWFLAGLSAGTLLVAAAITGHMLSGGLDELFQRGRLYGPLGYANGLALCLVLAIWPLVAFAAEPTWAVARGAALAGATLLAALAVLAQSRGVVVASAAGVVVLLAFGERRTTRAWALLAVAAGVLAILGPLLAVYSDATGLEKLVRPSDALAAALAALAAALGVGLAWTAGCALLSRLGEPARERIARAGRIALLAVVGVALLGGLLSAPRIADEGARQWRAFAHDDRPQTGTASRFTAAGSQRREYWRVALLELRERPALGWGAGNFPARWFALRRTDEDVRQPHSVELQTLAELGVAGAAALLLLLVGCIGGLASPLRRRDRSPAVVVAAAVFATWLVATSIDWIALLPGVTGAVLVTTALVAARAQPAKPAVALSRSRVGVTVLAVASMLLLVVLTGRLLIADRWTTQAVSALADGHPAQALTRARQADALEPGGLRALYVQAAAFARADRYADARAVLLRAAARSPRDFVPHALLGDLAVRHGAPQAARAAYAAAARRNPRDLSLAPAARDPRSMGARR